MSALLRVRDLDAYYGHFQALSGIELDVDAGEAVAVIGANGAGKSTLLRAIAGLVAQPAGAHVELDGVELRGVPAHRRARMGVSLVPEGRKLFPSLTVRENLLIAASAAAGRSRDGERRWSLDAVYDLFPNVGRLRDRPGGALSGGEQQAVAIGRGLMAEPRVLLLDEVSLGLAPVVVEQLYAALGTIAASGMAMLVVEQDVGAALRLAGRVLCLRAGRTALTGAASQVTAAAVTAAYFGK
ncbi:ABC transporter ATP-binding protein [Pseudonocardia humida]|uniref:ABC transporter ATP-binding protein n=1 Tax=Pseudonocardia humida TaxID=2800819 RepID=A0ABT0ZSB1_9PSEU|nr:ATP-binding cassette domain-containing protein [Pseudonocardia humida]MCO1653594.1 ABC transporter ATP-binding protein [Pseudonocardia humida]